MGAPCPAPRSICTAGGADPTHCSFPSLSAAPAPPPCVIPPGRRRPGPLTLPIAHHGDHPDAHKMGDVLGSCCAPPGTAARCPLCGDLGGPAPINPQSYLLPLIRLPVLPTALRTTQRPLWQHTPLIRYRGPSCPLVPHWGHLTPGPPHGLSRPGVRRWGRRRSIRCSCIAAGDVAPRHLPRSPAAWRPLRLRSPGQWGFSLPATPGSRGRPQRGGPGWRLGAAQPSAAPPAGEEPLQPRSPQPWGKLVCLAQGLQRPGGAQGTPPPTMAYPAPPRSTRSSLMPHPTSPSFLIPEPAAMGGGDGQQGLAPPVPGRVSGAAAPLPPPMTRAGRSSTARTNPLPWRGEQTLQDTQWI